MKRLMTVFTFVLMTAAVYSQGDYDHYVYCELRFVQGTTSVQVFFQEGYTFDKELMDAQGKPLVFKSLIEGLNGLSRKKWELFAVYQGSDGPRFLLRKLNSTIKPMF